MQFKTPVVFIIFNRPDLTKRVFDIISQSKPSKLLVIADGPRKDDSDDLEKCAAAREVVDQIDWDCEVFKNYAENNLGCKKRIASGLDWVFELVEEAIILEDDCLPDPTFFRFCEEMLKYYRDDKRIMTISGSNFLFGNRLISDSYYFSRYNHTWGWATWRRAWAYFDITMPHWMFLSRNNWLNETLNSRRAARYWSDRFQSVYQNQIDSWGYIWTLTCWSQNGLNVIPKVNLVSNIGFGPEATHTRDTKNSLFNMPATSMNFPLNHPPIMTRNYSADTFVEESIFSLSFKLKIQRRINKFSQKILYFK